MKVRIEGGSWYRVRLEGPISATCGVMVLATNGVLAEFGPLGFEDRSDALRRKMRARIGQALEVISMRIPEADLA